MVPREGDGSVGAAYFSPTDRWEWEQEGRDEMEMRAVEVGAAREATMPHTSGAAVGRGTITYFMQERGRTNIHVSAPRVCRLRLRCEKESTSLILFSCIVRYITNPTHD